MCDGHVQLRPDETVQQLAEAAVLPPPLAQLARAEADILELIAAFAVVGGAVDGSV